MEWIQHLSYIRIAIDQDNKIPTLFTRAYISRRSNDENCMLYGDHERKHNVIDKRNEIIKIHHSNGVNADKYSSAICWFYSLWMSLSWLLSFSFPSFFLVIIFPFQIPILLLLRQRIKKNLQQFVAEKILKDGMKTVQNILDWSKTQKFITWIESFSTLKLLFIVSILFFSVLPCHCCYHRGCSLNKTSI